MRKPTVRQLARKMGMSSAELLDKLQSMGSSVKSERDVVDINPLEFGVRRFFWPLFILVVIMLWIVFGLWLAFG